mmetsp:Transcript_28/g.65  ORF Transcript_28/g.65 Transcript_28/m.65 type:complete len:232 (-) Transcript_28:483-1178(-)
MFAEFDQKSGLFDKRVGHSHVPRCCCCFEILGMHLLCVGVIIANNLLCVGVIVANDFCVCQQQYIKNNSANICLFVVCCHLLEEVGSWESTLLLGIVVGVIVANEIGSLDISPLRVAIYSLAISVVARSGVHFHPSKIFGAPTQTSKANLHFWPVVGVAKDSPKMQQLVVFVVIVVVGFYFFVSLYQSLSAFTNNNSLPTLTPTTLKHLTTFDEMPHVQPEGHSNNSVVDV